MKWQEHEPNTSVLRICDVTGIDCMAWMICVKYYIGCGSDENLLTYNMCMLTAVVLKYVSTIKLQLQYTFMYSAHYQFVILL